MVLGISLQEQQMQNEKAKAIERYKNQIRIFILIGGILIGLVAAFFFYRSSKQKQRDALRIQKAYDQLKSTQAQLVQSEKMASLGELTAGIAHEIQNPLNFVNNFSEVNKELLIEMRDEIDKGNLSEVKSIADHVIINQEKINDHGKRADAIVKGMLQHSRQSTGQKESVDINALADEWLRLAYHGVRAKEKDFHAILRTAFAEQKEVVNIIPQDVGRVFLNLYNNAFYAVRQKQNLHIPGYEGTVTVS
jgi:C4-dicarboxylate-specific signal transduction histidine kinase